MENNETEEEFKDWLNTSYIRHVESTMDIYNTALVKLGCPYKLTLVKTEVEDSPSKDNNGGGASL